MRKARILAAAVGVMLPVGLVGLAFGFASAGCRTFVIPGDGGSGDCPAEPPAGGEPCGAPALCAYPGGGCGGTFACTGTEWVLADQGCPVPEAGACPTDIPTPGAPCSIGGQACTFDVPGQCPGVFVATCDGGQWAVADQSPPCVPSTCPTTEPMAGAPCSQASSSSCTYTVVPPGCSPQTQDATCLSGAWVIAAPPCMP